MMLAAVMAGGALGALSRYWVNAVFHPEGEDGFPTGTLIINISGSFTAGLVAGFAAQMDIPEVLLAGMLTGFLSAYTTFSSWMVQQAAMIEARTFKIAVIYLLVSVTAGIVSALAGVLLSGLFLS